MAVGEIPISDTPELIYTFLTTVAGWIRPRGGEYVIWDLVPTAKYILVLDRLYNTKKKRLFYLYSLKIKRDLKSFYKFFYSI